MNGYAKFLESKQRTTPDIGRPCDPADVHSMLHPWQAECVAWAVRKGRAALWWDTGLGKTLAQIEWARLSASNALIVAPLAVCAQTVREAAKVGVLAHYVRDDSQIGGPGVWVTSYEMVERIDTARFGAVVLDEASILKQSDGKTRRLLIERFASVRARLACTATPAPNDVEELTNQAEFIGVASRVEMLSAYFVHDDQGWRLKGHAADAMWRWVASWAVALRKPSDMGYPDGGYDLPPLTITPHLLPVDVAPEGQLFATDLGGVGGRAAVRRSTLAARVAKAVEIVRAEPHEQWLLWCGLNDEASSLTAAIPGAVNMDGSWPPEDKAAAILAFSDGQIQTLVTKTSIAGQGLNWQQCARMVFVGLSDSYEAYYQAIRRCWRYGQTRPVTAHIVLSELEGSIAVNVLRKEREAKAWTAQIVEAVRERRNAA